MDGFTYLQQCILKGDQEHNQSARVYRYKHQQEAYQEHDQQTSNHHQLDWSYHSVSRSVHLPFVEVENNNITVVAIEKRKLLLNKLTWSKKTKIKNKLTTSFNMRIVLLTSPIPGGSRASFNIIAGGPSSSNLTFKMTCSKGALCVRREKERVYK